MDAKYYEMRARQRAEAAAQAQASAVGAGAIVVYEDPSKFTPIFTPSSAGNETARYYERRAMARSAGVGGVPTISATLAQTVAGLLGR